MANDQISFSCSSCGVELKVPASFAGVTGPCPGCQAPITAPSPPTEENPPAFVVPSVPQAPAPTPAPTPAPAPAAAAAAEPPSPTPAPIPEVASPPPQAPKELIPAASASVPTPSVPSPPEDSAPSETTPTVPSTTFPSAPAQATAPQSAKTVLPPRRGDIELQAGLASVPARELGSASLPASESSRFPSSLNPPVSAPETSMSSRTPPTETSAPKPQSPAASPSTPAQPMSGGPTPVPSPSTQIPSASSSASNIPSPSVPRLEPTSGQAAYTIPQHASAVSAIPHPGVTAIPGQQMASPPAAQPAPQAPTPSAPAPASAVAQLPVSGSLSTFAPTQQDEAASQNATLPKQRNLRWLRFLIPVLFLGLCAIVVYAVMDLNKRVSSNDLDVEPLDVLTAPNHSARQHAKDKIVSNGSGRSNSGLSQIPSRLDPVSADVPAVDPSDLYVEGEIPPSPRLKETPASPAKVIPLNTADPTAVLERFLGASTLEERKAILSPSNRTPAELATSSLSKPLPEVINSRLLHYMVNDAERHTEHFFEVSFQKFPNQRPYHILVQINDWGEGKCKIHTDAFLDLYDDALTAFAAKPVAGPRTFHVIADAYKHCFDEIIPEWDKKSFLKLRNHPGMSPRLIAYFNRTSPLADQISRPNALPWGESGICTIRVAWNIEDPERPFVELLEVTGFTWEP